MPVSSPTSRPESPAMHAQGSRLQAGRPERDSADRQGHILWLAFGHDCETNLSAAMPMSDVIADVLKDPEPMRPAELVAALSRPGLLATLWRGFLDTERTCSVVCSVSSIQRLCVAV